MQRSNSRYDASQPLTSPLLHGTTCMGAGTVAIALLAQVNPKFFLADKHVGVKWYGHLPQRLLLLPSVTVLALYLAAGIQIYEGNYVRAHASSMLLSFALAAGCVKMAPHSFIYWLLFGLYTSYGALYDGRRLALYSDGAPGYRPGDLQRIKEMRLAAHAARDRELEHAVALKKKQYEAALAALEKEKALAQG